MRGNTYSYVMPNPVERECSTKTGLGVGSEEAVYCALVLRAQEDASAISMGEEVAGSFRAFSRLDPTRGGGGPEGLDALCLQVLHDLRFDWT